MSTSPNPNSNKWADAARRFGFYFIGMAIGLMLLGFFQMKKQQQAAEIKARQEAAQQQASQPQSAPAQPAPHQPAPIATPTNTNPPQNQAAPK